MTKASSKATKDTTKEDDTPMVLEDTTPEEDDVKTEPVKRESRLERLHRELQEETEKERERLLKTREKNEEALERAHNQIERWTGIARKLSDENDRIDILIQPTTGPSSYSPQDEDTLAQQISSVYNSDITGYTSEDE